MGPLFFYDELPHLCGGCRELNPLIIWITLVLAVKNLSFFLFLMNIC